MPAILNRKLKPLPVHSFEYAILRIVPKVEREEFVNIGVIVFCKTERYLQVKIAVNEKKVKALCEKTDIGELESYLAAFESIALGTNKDSPIAKLDIASRFRWLTATRSTVIQTSKVHPGLCNDADEKLHRLFAEYVL